MRLTHIKLAGFKSFVDPTAIPVPGQLVAVVGPNGCGKSNVIDAVRWVLGESSAKQLRGESMQDVIFNGSTGRKPVSRASVELVFNNAEGRAAGQWSTFAEISIKRILTRQGESSYFINNIQCRRRDIADLFLGTGVGTRGYAVIEQGMISRIIEARPEELRAFLEEAAGISKYKERRRETESRLTDTRDNLARVDDIRQELEQQLARLASQAEVASRYHEMKRSVVEKQNLLALQRKFDAARDEEKARRDMSATQNEIEALTARVREAEAEIERLRESHYDAHDAVQRSQTEWADANARVAKLEQQLLHLRETRQRLSQQLAQAKAQLEQNARSRTDLDGEREQWQQRLEDATLAQEDGQIALLDEQTELPRLEAHYKACDESLQTAQLALSQARQGRQLAEQQLQHLERSLNQLRQRRDRLEAEAAALSPPDLPALDDKRLEVESLSLAVEDAQARLEALDQASHEAEAERSHARHEQERLRAERAELQARRDALAQLQAQAGRDRTLDQWLMRHGLDPNARLFRHLKIEAGWETAVEAVLRERMNALAVEPGFGAAEPAPARLTLVWPGVVPAASTTLSTATPLLNHVKADNPAFAAALADWLAQVWCVADEAALLAVAASLPPAGLAVAPSGHAVSRYGLHYYAPDNALAGVLQREKDLADCEQRLAGVEAALAAAATALLTAERTLGERHAELKHARQRFDALRGQRGERQVELARLSQAAEHARVRIEALTAERQAVAEELAELALESEAARQELEGGSNGLPALETALTAAREARGEAEVALQRQRERLRAAERAAQEAGFARQAATQKLAELDRRLGELEVQREETQLRLEEVGFDLEGIDEGEFDVGFQAAIEARAERERALAASRDAAQTLSNALREAELGRQQLQEAFEPLRERLGELKLKEQEARLAVERFAQELTEAGADEAALRPLLGEGLKIQALVGEIGRLTQAINSLGNVNLAALEELETARERKTYLDAQAADLVEAMETLEGAIRRIDRETRAMLQSTFDQVNASLQELFPTLFGGGHAELILTGDEILDAGIQIMAQPPGKKNSTIHLLSGGEKALTALSLVFSLFRLNPAPFCLLDEVDAPLDDANTGRFCEMVKRMAERTQFLYISHNKITMEMADQLIGITMQEQGVSRVVAVDIAAALAMREGAEA
ncbi:chromosome segregation protein SMC [Chitinimonas lacunae]|uniref:Chromosome partition protein Smc n=1 Tax=Chitinimonas lacunae TaxID=1963018 RepID=A0ABV8MNN8_9NEIS